jgi:large subunit ribosomal protein L31
MEVGSTQPELRVDVWSGNHPFFTGEQRIIDTAGQVERFMSRLNRFSEHQADVQVRQKQAQQKVEQKFTRQQIVALDLGNSVEQALIDAGVVTVGDLESRLKKDPDSLLKIEGITERVVSEAKSKLRQARAQLGS